MNVRWIQSAGTGTFNLQAASIVGDPTISGLERTIGNSGLVQVYPNPYKEGELTIKMENSENYVVSIVDLTGKIVYKSKFFASEINIPQMAVSKGIYIVNVASNKYVDNVKLVVK